MVSENGQSWEQLLEELELTKQQLAFHQSLYETASYMAVSVDPHSGKIKQCNQTLATKLGYLKSEIIGQSIFELYHPDCMPQVEIAFQTFVKAGEVHNFELELQRKDGTKIPVSLNITSIRDETGAILYSNSVWHDLSQRKRQETLLQRAYDDAKKQVAAQTDALRYSLDELDRIYALSPNLIGVSDLEGNYRTINPTWEDILGYENHELIGKSYLEIVHPDDRDAAQQHKAQMLQEETVYHHENRIQCKDGTYRWIAWQTRPDVEQGLVYFIAQDITVRKQTELALLQYEHIVSSSSDLISYLDQDYIYQIVNEHYLTYWQKSREAIIGYGVEELLGKDVFEKTLKPFLDRCLAGEAVQYQAWFDFPSQGRRYADVTYNPVKNSNDTVIGVVVSVRDVTALKQSQTDLEEALRQLKKTNQDLQQFAYVASHDLQEPLRAITSYLKLFARRYEGQIDEKADKYIRHAVEGATRMQQLIHDLLTFSRIGRTNQPPQACAINTIVHDVVTDLAILIAEHSAKITADPLPTILIDPSQWRQLFQNLVSNAIKFRSDLPPHIHIAVQDHADHWTFSVHDNGIGIEPEFHDRVFGIFQRLHTRDEYPGTGIGLAICKQIVEQHQGEIWVNSQLGEGTTISFTILKSGGRDA